MANRQRSFPVLHLSEKLLSPHLAVRAFCGCKQLEHTKLDDSDQWLSRAKVVPVFCSVRLCKVWTQGRGVLFARASKLSHSSVFPLWLGQHLGLPPENVNAQ